MNDNIEIQSVEEIDQKRRTLIFAMLGVVIVGTCALFLLAYSWFQPDQTSLFAKYFPSPLQPAAHQHTRTNHPHPKSDGNSTSLDQARPISLAGKR
jgi:hypothetical protein